MQITEIIELGLLLTLCHISDEFIILKKVI